MKRNRYRASWTTWSTRPGGQDLSRLLQSYNRFEIFQLFFSFKTSWSRINLPVETFDLKLAVEDFWGFFSLTSLFCFFWYLSLCPSLRRVPERRGSCCPHGSVHHSLQSDGAGGESSDHRDPSGSDSKHFTLCHTVYHPEWITQSLLRPKLLGK